VNQVQKNAKDINSRLVLLERTVLFKRYHSKSETGLPGSKVGCIGMFVDMWM
jgi:hypothetical protein